MINTISISRRTLTIDALCLIAICLVPVASHLLALPLQALEPMRMALLASLLLVNDRRNAYLMALLLPLVSMMVTGMPMGGKCAMMSFELLTNVAVFHLLEQRTGVWAGMLLSILASKVVYYGLKFAVVGSLVATTVWWLQLAVVVLLASIFALIYKRLR